MEKGDADSVLDAVGTITDAMAPGHSYMFGLDTPLFVAQGTNEEDPEKRFVIINSMLNKVLRDLRAKHNITDDKEFANFMRQLGKKQAAEHGG